MVITMLNMKWRTFGLYVFLVSIMLYLSFLAVLTSYALCLPKPSRNMCEFVCMYSMRELYVEVLCICVFALSRAKPIITVYMLCKKE